MKLQADIQCDPRCRKDRVVVTEQESGAQPMYPVDDNVFDLRPHGKKSLVNVLVRSVRISRASWNTVRRITTTCLSPSWCRAIQASFSLRRDFAESRARCSLSHTPSKARLHLDTDAQ